MTPKPVNSRVLVQLRDPARQSVILRPDGSRMLDPIGTVTHADPNVKECKVGDEVLFSNTEFVITAPAELGERMYFVIERDILAILDPE